MRRASLFLACAVLASCSTRTYRGSGVTRPIQRDPVLAGERVFIPIERVHYRDYDVEHHASFVGTRQLSNEDTEITDVDRLGTVIIDLRTGTCTILQVAAPERRPPERRLAHGASVFEAGPMAPVRELGGEPATTIAEYPPPSVTPSNGYYALSLLGIAGYRIVFYRSDLETVYAFDVSVRAWGEYSYRRCLPR